MICPYCGRINDCHPRCPNYVFPKSNYYCDLCGDPILDEEEYIRNDDGEYRHWDCFYDKEDLAVWLGYKIEKMEGD